MLRKCYLIIIVLISLIVVFHPGRHAKYYHYIATRNVLNELIIEQNHTRYSNPKFCPEEFYTQLIGEEIEVNIEDVYRISNFVPPLKGGENVPRDCRPIFKTAVIVPYRKREKHLETFLNYMHTFLQKQKLHYKIFIVEQNNDLPFNRAKMLNVGANEAIQMNFSCIILHDVDLIPLTLGNIYACSKKPRHMSSSIDTFRFNLPYYGLSGGALSIQSEHYRKINGMSNVFDGWGGEDDDFFKRLEAHDLIPYRFAPEISRYTMLFHNKEKGSKNRWEILENSLERQQVDGLNSIPRNYKVVLKPLYTHVVV